MRELRHNLGLCARCGRCAQHARQTLECALEKHCERQEEESVVG